MTTDRDGVFTSIENCLSPEAIERHGLARFPYGPDGHERDVAQVVTRLCCALAEAEERIGKLRMAAVFASQAIGANVTALEIGMSKESACRKLLTAEARLRAALTAESPAAPQDAGGETSR